MITRGQKIRLGFFVVVSASLIAAMIVVLLGNELGQEQDIYSTRFTETVSGLEVGAPVKYHGVRVGTVESIEIDREQVEEVIVTLALKRKTPVKEDTLVVMNTMGITGLKFLELTGGTDNTPFRTAGGEIPSGPSFMHKLTGKADVITEKIELLVNNLVDLTGEEQQTRIAAMLEDGSQTLSSVRKLITDNEEELDTAVKDLAATAKELRKVSGNVDERLDRIEGDVRLVVTDVRQLVGQLEGAVSQQNDNISVVMGQSSDVVSSVQTLLDNRDVRQVPREVLQAIQATRSLVTNAESRLTRLATTLNDGASVLHDRLSDQRLDQTLNNLVTLSSNMDGLVKTMDLTMRQSREDIFKTLGNLEDVVRNLNDFTQMLLENPSILLRGSQLKERDL